MIVVEIDVFIYEEASLLIGLQFYSVNTFCFENVLNHCTKIAADKISWSSNKSIGEVSIDVGFKPKIFIIRNNSGITINSTESTSL